MSLPPGFLDEIRARLPLSDVVGRRVTWDSRKSNPARGDYWACCPFHEEKSPSFHVDDRRGFYKCFGCHASGDHVRFLRERENMGFMEAVEALARDAGLEMPKRDPAAAARAEKGRDLAAVMEEAATFYRAQLRAARGRDALGYLRGRGLAEETLARFELGYAPAERRALFEHLRAKGVEEARIVEAGLAARPEDGGAPYDRFRDRVIFPIRDPQGRCIAFGGRAMGAEAKAKYLNSPETPLFDKSRTLYNHGPARAAAARARALVVVEGYMDAIALAEAGIGHVVAPLGTAITEHHLTLLWRIADEPVIALDGDAAGRGAALRAADLALPLLEAGRSLRFALMPPGLDPDDLARREGAEGVQAKLDAAEPIVALLWRRETEGRVFDSPERRAALDARLKALLGRISDPVVRGHYRAAFADLRADLFAPRRRPAPRRGDGSARGGARGPDPRRVAAMPTPETLAGALARGVGEARWREAAILIALANHPHLLPEHEDALMEATFEEPDLDALKCALLPPDDAAGDAAETARSLAREFGGAAPPFARPDAEDAADGLKEAVERHLAYLAMRAELAETEAEFRGDGAEWAWRRLMAARAAAEAGARGRQPEAETEVEPISARIDAILAAKRGRKGR